MKKTRFTEEQMVTILREADQRPVPEVAKKHGVTAPSTLSGSAPHTLGFSFINRETGEILEPAALGFRRKCLGGQQRATRQGTVSA
jgi:hypothetical protein